MFLLSESFKKTPFAKTHALDSVSRQPGFLFEDYRLNVRIIIPEKLAAN